MNVYDSDAVEERLREAINWLLNRDRFLLVNNVNERSISHKLAEHLQVIFPDWHVDCEYNRNHASVKKLRFEPSNLSADDTQGTTVYPDIIVHRRGTKQNLLVIEVKKSTNVDNGDFDREKLDLFIADLGYTCGAFVEFATGLEDVGYKLELFSSDGS